MILTNNWQRNKILKSSQYQTKAFDTVNELVFKKRHGRLITLTDNTTLIEFVSCSYLGLDTNAKVLEASYKNILDCGITFPAARTRFKAESFCVLEELLKKIFCNSHTILFQSLHMAHLGLLPLLASGELPSYPLSRNGLKFIIDRKAHASMQINRGLMKQFAEVVVVDFNQLNLIEELFLQAKQKNITPIALIDSVGSMGGIAPIGDLFKLAEEYLGYIYLDDAHGTSIFGKHGCGYVLQELNYNYHPRLILTLSLSKAFGSVGGLIALPREKDAEMVKRFASTYIFSGPPALSIVDAAIASAEIHLSDEIYHLQDLLQQKISYFDALVPDLTCKANIINYQTASPIRGIIIGDEFKAIEITSQLRRAGFAVTAAMYPSVAKGQAMLRITLGVDHRKEDIKRLIDCLKQLLSQIEE